MFKIGKRRKDSDSRERPALLKTNIMYEGFEKNLVPSDHPTVYIAFAFLFIAFVIICWQFAAYYKINGKKNEK